MRRTVRPELLDTGEVTPEERRKSLDDLRFVNRWFGGTTTSVSILDRVVAREQRTLTLLDVGSATGDTATRIQKQFDVRCTLLDRVPSHFNGASARFTCVAADALSLPFHDSSFDVVSCSLFAHHLEPDALVHFANEALRVSRTALLINDLRRSYLHLALIYAGMPLYRSRATRHDSIASVQRAYTPADLAQMLKRSRARSVEIHRTYLCRMGAIAWK